MRTALQLFGFLRDRKGDPMEALRGVRAMGFTAIEPCLAPEPVPGWEHVFWPLGYLEEHMDAIRALGLTVVSCHLITDTPDRFATPLCRLAEKTGIRRFVIKCPPQPTGEALQAFAFRAMRLSDALRACGAELLCHNEADGIRLRRNGRTLYESFLDMCLGKVLAQVDIGWAWFGGEDPEALLWRLGPRVRSVHFKDFASAGTADAEVPAGCGRVPTLACFQFARAFGADQVVDMDRSDQPMEDALKASLHTLQSLAGEREGTHSFLNVLDTLTGEVRVLKAFDHVIEAPNWLKTREEIIYNAGGLIYAFSLSDGSIAKVDTGTCDACNNDHVLSPDESEIAVSHMTFTEGFSSRVYRIPFSGGGPRLVTPNSPSFLHGWSPDGAEMAYCAFREYGGKREVDVYTIPAGGGEEKRLTHGGFNDGPEYSPDGRFIWFNSTRSGLMQAYRMPREGGEAEQMTHTDRNNWFPHVSPDGRLVAYLSYGKNDLLPEEHLPNMHVQLRLMNTDGTGDRLLLSFFGGQGSLNVNSWSPDSRHLAFVSYELLHA